MSAMAPSSVHDKYTTIAMAPSSVHDKYSTIVTNFYEQTMVPLLS